MTAPVVVLITDPRYGVARTATVIRQAALALAPGMLLVQLRDKHASDAALLESARSLRIVTREAGARFVINGALEVARAVGADGVHVPNERAATVARLTEARARLGEHALLTTTAHDDDDVRHAVLAGATAVLVSPIFESPGKGAARGTSAIASARAIVDAARRTPPMLVYALGGVTGENAASCREAGADGVCAIRAIYDGGAGGGEGAAALGTPFAGAGRSRTP